MEVIDFNTGWTFAPVDNGNRVLVDLPHDAMFHEKRTKLSKGNGIRIKTLSVKPAVIAAEIKTNSAGKITAVAFDRDGNQIGSHDLVTEWKKNLLH